MAEKGRHTEYCSSCNAPFQAAYHKAVRLCPECAGKADRKRRRERYWKRKAAEGAPKKKRGLVCPYSPDCEKCPKPDCVIEFAYRYNILEADSYGSRTKED